MGKSYTFSMTRYSKPFIYSLIFLFVFAIVTPAHARPLTTPKDSVEINGDEVEYATDGDRILARGNVIIIYNDATLYCDEVDFSQSTSIAHAKGNVRLVTPDGEVTGDKLTYNFEAERGDLNRTAIVAHPYYAAGRYAARVDDNKVVITDGFFTTSDFDKPEYRIHSKKIEVYPGDKLVARNVRIMLGNVPLMYLPRYTQNLKDDRVRFAVIPGSSKEWGDFLLTRYRFNITDDVDATLRMDYRTKRDFGWGFDFEYRTPRYGNGLLKTYYTNERLHNETHFWEASDALISERERYKIEWRHKWDIDEKTTAIAQYYLLSDENFLKDFFEREFKNDSNPETFFLITKSLPKGTLSLRTDVRINRFTSAVERLPELRYNLASTEIPDTGFYLRSESTLSKLVKKSASPSETRQKTTRFHTDNELSYPMKVGFIEFKPFVGTEQTFYTRTASATKNDELRGNFKGGVSASTKFYRIFDAEMSRWGFDANRLRHIITPSISYNYTSGPTIPSSDLDIYDDIDSRDQVHKITYSLENKLQTKKDGKNHDLLRAIFDVDYLLKENPGRPGFADINAQIDIRPTDWLGIYFDGNYDTKTDRVEEANVDLYITNEDRWRFAVGNRFARGVDNLVTTDFQLKINQKWKLALYNRYDIDGGDQQEFDAVLTRDLHAWEFDINYNTTRGQGSEVLFVFRLKAFPELGFDAGTTFNERKPGSQQ